MFIKCFDTVRIKEFIFGQCTVVKKGKYIFEYDYICNAVGKFSNGITIFQNYYAPQMNANTQGTRVEILEQ